ncbi:MAG: glycosyl transferase [Sphingomonas bacterium]|nr:glycosyl transferase [Sphingomonas bacterium]
MNRDPGQVCAIIPAFNAQATIGRAVRSALIQAEVGEVIVVDDGSTDATGAAAWGADDGTGRLRLIRLDGNRGPSAARNAALHVSRAPLIAILDADDHLLPGRFAALADDGTWDMLADNIVFLPEGREGLIDADLLDRLPDRRRIIDFAEFVDRNVSRRGAPRAEFGFVKPVIRRSMLGRLGLRYDENLRLGEDFILYATALARGARFQLSTRCGYVAIERAGSLSGRHRTADLAALTVAGVALLRSLPTATAGAAADRRALARHLDALRRKLAHRQFLDRKAQAGLVAATAPLLGHPRRLAGVAADIAADKLRRPLAPISSQRLLFAMPGPEWGTAGATPVSAIS